MQKSFNNFGEKKWIRTLHLFDAFLTFPKTFAIHAGNRQREKEERAVSIIPGASSAEELEDDFEKQQDDGKETIVVCYCTIGYRSQKKVQEL